MPKRNAEGQCDIRQNYAPLSVIAAVSLCDGVGRTRRLVCSRVAQRLGTPLLSSEADRAARGDTCSVGARPVVDEGAVPQAGATRKWASSASVWMAPR